MEVFFYHLLWTGLYQHTSSRRIWTWN